MHSEGTPFKCTHFSHQLIQLCSATSICSSFPTFESPPLFVSQLTCCILLFFPCLPQSICSPQSLTDQVQKFGDVPPLPSNSSASSSQSQNCQAIEKHFQSQNSVNPTHQKFEKMSLTMTMPVHPVALLRKVGRWQAPWMQRAGRFML